MARIVNLRISAPFSKRLRHRCVRDDNDDERVNDHSLPRQLGNRIMPILQSLQDGRLRTFNWDLGACVPRQILGKSGYLPTHQSRIQHLRLVTDPTCGCNSQSSILALQELRSLKGLSWTGLRTRPEFVALGLALEENASHLEALELDFIDWELVRNHWIDMDDDVVRDLFKFALKVRPRSINVRYPVIAKLSLSGLDLTSYFRGIAYAMNSPSLRSITLRRCTGWELFLQRLMELDEQLNITSLEVYQPLGVEPISDNEEHVLRTFIESINGLENLCLSLPSPTDTKALWRTALRHKATLQRFVYHARSVILDDESEFFEEEVDLNDMALLSDSFLASLINGEDSEDRVDLLDDMWFTNQAPNPLAELTLECTGLACHPRRLMEVLEPFSSKKSLQVLHIRQSGSDIQQFGSWVFSKILMDDATWCEGNLGPGRRYICEDGILSWVSCQIDGIDQQNIVATILTDDFRRFADWAFGANGVSSLQLIAYGDFSCQGRFADNCFMLRRGWLTDSDWRPYRFYSPYVQREPDLEELLDRYGGFLEACPTNTLL